MRQFVVANETNGFALCYVLKSRRIAYIASRSSCYKALKDLQQRFPRQKYTVYELVGVKSRRKQ